MPISEWRHGTACVVMCGHHSQRSMRTAALLAGEQHRGRIAGLVDLGELSHLESKLKPAMKDADLGVMWVVL